MKNLIYALFLLLTLLSCEDTLNITLPYGGDKFVLFSELSPNKNIELKIERTYPPTGTFSLDSKYLLNTTAVLFENGIIVDTLKRKGTSNVFESSKKLRPKIGNKYYFEVKAENFITATSKEQIVPKIIEIVNVGFSNDNVTSPLNSSSPAKLLKITFKKTDEVNIYFVVEITGQYNGIRTSNGIISSKVPVEFGDPCIYDLASFLKIYNNKCYNKNTNEISFIVELEGSLQEPPGGNKKINNLNIKISSVDNFYYDFISSYNPPDGIFKAFQPVKPTVTNVKNGFGAVFGKNEYVLNYKVN